MRLDKFLQVSRLIKRRTVANSICSRGRVLVNGHPAKAGKDLSVGDVLSIDFGEEEPAVYEVLAVPSGNVPRGRSATLYRRIDESVDSE